jgi:putative DNA primase/helicase
VGEAACLAACAWAEYLEGHARRLYAPATASETHAAKELLRHIIRGDMTGPFTSREVSRKGWRGLDRTGVVGALELLTEHGYLAAEQRVTGGRPSLLYHTNPRLGG